LSWIMMGSSGRDCCAKTGPLRIISAIALVAIFPMVVTPARAPLVKSNMARRVAQCDEIFAQPAVLLGIRLRWPGIGGFGHVAIAPDVAVVGAWPPAPRLDSRGGARSFRSAISGTDFPCRTGAPRKFRSCRGTDFDLVVDKNRRLPGGLRVLPAIDEIRHRGES